MISELKISELKDSFCDLLRSVGRPHTEEVISELESIGFFRSPASSKDHLSCEGGLLAHSMNTYRMATLLVNDLRLFRSDMPSSDSIIIASLLHDISKAQRYVKQPDGSYLKDYSRFPAGHGEKSVIQLLRIGYPLTDKEILAIEYHMGAFRLPLHCEEADKDYREACKYPLVPIIHAADTLAAQVIEVEQLTDSFPSGTTFYEDG